MAINEQACGAVYPKGDNLYCLRLSGHEEPHATCLGYHPEWVDQQGLQHSGEFEWDEWWTVVGAIDFINAAASEGKK